MVSRVGSRLAGAALVTAAVVVATASGTASAMFHRGPTLSSGDDRATAHQVRQGLQVSCRDAGLSGDEVGVQGFTDDARRRLTVTSLPPGAQITGLVVRGWLVYNVYPVAGLGGLPFQDLRAPIDRGDDSVQIVHWFACGSVTTSSVATTTPSGTPSGHGGPETSGAPAPTDGAPPTGSPNAPTSPTGAAPTPTPTGGSADTADTPGTDPDPATPGTAGGPGERPRGPNGGAGAGAPGAPTAHGGALATLATLAPLASDLPPRPDPAALRTAARSGPGGLAVLALVLLLAVTGGLLMVAPTRLTRSRARPRHLS